MEVMPHLKLRDDLGIQYAILPGDPARWSGSQNS